MLEALVVILVIMWALGFFVVHIGSVIHAVLVIAIVIAVIRVLQGRPVAP